MNNIVLIGMPAAGKSTVGVVLAKRLAYRYLDPDLLIQEQEGRLLNEIIAEKGLEGFLEIEGTVNEKVQAEKTIIAPGGSVIYSEKAMRHYQKIGKILYLQASLETIRERLGDPADRGVVLRQGQTLKDLFDERVPLFEKYADITVCEDGLTLRETIEKVMDALKYYGFIT